MIPSSNGAYLGSETIDVGENHEKRSPDRIGKKPDGRHQGISMNREEELKKQGWEKRFTLDEPRLSEMAALYEELGFEILLEPADLSSEECTRCFEKDPGRYKTLYTRSKK